MAAKGDRGALKSSGLRNTRQRQAIYNALQTSDALLTAEELFLKLKGAGAGVCFSTVYRTLEALAGKGLIEKSLLPGDDRARYQLKAPQHLHQLICLGCNRTVGIDHCPLADLQQQLAERTNYTVAGHRLEFFGYCPECRAKGDA